MSPNPPKAGSPASASVAGGPNEGASRRSDRTRDRIVDAAQEAFGRLGYHATSIVEITRGAGVGLGTFYVYFPSKIEIYRHVLRSRQEDVMEAARTAAEGTGDYRDLMRDSFGAFFDWIGARPFILRLLREAEFVDPSLLADFYAGPAEEYRKTLERAMDRGHIPKADAEMLAWSVIGMTELAILRWMVWPGKTRMDPEHFEAFMDIVARTLAIQPAKSD